MAASYDGTYDDSKLSPVLQQFVDSTRRDIEMRKEVSEHHKRAADNLEGIHALMQRMKKEEE
jgi:hypothetical protein